MENKNNHYEARGPGSRFACCYTKDRDLCFWCATMAQLETQIPFEVYEIDINGEERRIS
jgi:hypothetical protein